jgi:hypothetical protein
MPPKTILSFDEAAAAHVTVQNTIAALRGEHATVTSEIEATAAELARQQNLRLPVGDLRAALVEMFAATAKHFEKTSRAAIAAFAKHNFGDPVEIPIDVKMSRKPMSFAYVEQIILGEIKSYSPINLLRGEAINAFDGPLLMLLGDVVFKRLVEILDEISPEEFGYGNVKDSEIGCGLQERRALVLSLQNQLTDLEARREDIVRKLVALGYFIANEKNKW